MTPIRPRKRLLPLLAIIERTARAERDFYDPAPEPFDPEAYAREYAAASPQQRAFMDACERIMWAGSRP